MIKLIYDAGVGMSDVGASRQAQTDIAYQNGDGEYRFGNDTYLREWQIAMIKGQVDYHIVQAVFPDDECAFNEFGIMVGDPDETWFMSKQYATLLKLQVQKRLEKRA